MRNERTSLRTFLDATTRRVRTVVAAAAIAAATATSAAAGTVTVETPATAFVDSGTIARVCGGGGKVEACTAFTAYRLEADCSRDGNSWRLRAAASFRPRILMLRVKHLPHEMLHVEDVRLALEQYVAALESVSYPGEENCRDAAAVAFAGYEAQVRHFAALSTAMRDSSLALAARH